MLQKPETDIQARGFLSIYYTSHTKGDDIPRLRSIALPEGSEKSTDVGGYILNDWEGFPGGGGWRHLRVAKA